MTVRVEITGADLEAYWATQDGGVIDGAFRRAMAEAGCLSTVAVAVGMASPGLDTIGYRRGPGCPWIDRPLNGAAALFMHRLDFDLNAPGPATFTVDVPTEMFPEGFAEIES